MIFCVFNIACKFFKLQKKQIKSGRFGGVENALQTVKDIFPRKDKDVGIPNPKNQPPTRTPCSTDTESPQDAVSAECKNDPEIDALFAWAEGNGIWRAKIGVTTFPLDDTEPTEMYRGVVALEPFVRRQPVVKIPFSSCMSIHSARECPILGPFLQVRPRIDSFDALGLHLLMELSKGTESKWATYMKTLPTREDLANIPLFWDEETIAARFDNDDSIEEIEDQKRVAKQTFQRLVTPFVKNHIVDASDDDQDNKDIKQSSDSFFTIEQWLWATAVMQSRTYSVAFNSGLEDATTEDGGVHTLVPIADMFNHKRGCLTIDYDVEKEETLVIKAAKKTAPGEQLFISYGDEYPSEHFRINYGF